MDELERIPCLDGSCVGTLGLDGRCTYCGLEGEEAPRRLEGAAADDEDAAAGDEGAALPSATVAGEGGAEDPWEERRLCPDGSCVGTLGPDGRCYVCGLEGA